MKKKSTSSQLHSDSDDHHPDRGYHNHHDYHHSSSRSHIKPSMSQSFSSSRGSFKSSSSSPERSQPIFRKQQQHQQQTHRGILKKHNNSEAAKSPSKPKETPEQWFQRIMKTKKLSPLDLCDLFSYGDTRKHPRVPLSHVCEVIFDLDSEVLDSGYDPVTPAMEEFLYQFSFEGTSENEGDETMILVDVKDALRSLNIWQSGATSPVKKATKNSSRALNDGPMDSESPTKALVLEVKNKKLQSVISSLQDANLRLSMQLDDAVKASQSMKSKVDKPQPFSTSVSISSASWLSSSELEDSKTSSESKLKNSVVSHHEDDLIRIANQLQ